MLRGHGSGATRWLSAIRSRPPPARPRVVGPGTWLAKRLHSAPASGSGRGRVVRPGRGFDAHQALISLPFSLPLLALRAFRCARALDVAFAIDCAEDWPRCRE